MNRVTDAFKSNGYPSNFFSNIKTRLSKKAADVPPTPEELVRQFFDLVELSITPTLY